MLIAAAVAQLLIDMVRDLYFCSSWGMGVPTQVAHMWLVNPHIQHSPEATGLVPGESR